MLSLSLALLGRSTDHSKRALDSAQDRDPALAHHHTRMSLVSHFDTRARRIRQSVPWAQSLVTRSRRAHLVRAHCTRPKICKQAVADPSGASSTCDTDTSSLGVHGTVAAKRRMPAASQQEHTERELKFRVLPARSFLAAFTAGLSVRATRGVWPELRADTPTARDPHSVCVWRRLKAKRYQPTIGSKLADSHRGMAGDPMGLRLLSGGDAYICSNYTLLSRARSANIPVLPLMLLDASREQCAQRRGFVVIAPMGYIHAVFMFWAIFVLIAAFLNFPMQSLLDYTYTVDAIQNFLLMFFFPIFCYRLQFSVCFLKQ